MGDLAPHNMLVRTDGAIRVLDFEFEYSGWDEPVTKSGQDHGDTLAIWKARWPWPLSAASHRERD